MRKCFLLLLLFNLCLAFAEENNLSQSFYFKGVKGQEIYAIEDGKVIDCGYDAEKGTFIKIDYPKIKLSIVYCNLSSFTYLPKNEVKKEDKIGKIGMSGNIWDYGSNVIITLHEDFLGENEMPKIQGGFVNVK